MSDAIRLTIPRTRPYYGVARLVVGGLAARLDLSFEYLEDLHVALESVVGNDAYASNADVTIELVVGDAAIEIAVGPLDRARVASELEEGDGDAAGVGLKRLLATVVETSSLEERDGATWLRLRKPIAAGAGR